MSRFTKYKRSLEIRSKMTEIDLSKISAKEWLDSMPKEQRELFWDIISGRVLLKEEICVGANRVTFDKEALYKGLKEGEKPSTPANLVLPKPVAMPIYSNLDDMFAAIRDEDGVLHPTCSPIDYNGGPVIHMYCGKWFDTLRDFMVSDCKEGKCKKEEQ